MENPWKEIGLDDYEAHMGLDSVSQLQAMNRMMKEQFSACPAASVMILGVAGETAWSISAVRASARSTAWTSTRPICKRAQAGILP